MLVLLGFCEMYGSGAVVDRNPGSAGDSLVPGESLVKLCSQIV